MRLLRWARRHPVIATCLVLLALEAAVAVANVVQCRRYEAWLRHAACEAERRGWNEYHSHTHHSYCYECDITLRDCVEQ